MQLRTVAVVGALGLTLGWALGTRLQPSQAGDAGSSSRSTGPRPLGTAPKAAPLTEQLRLRLEQKPAAPRPDRNPFTFSARRSAPPAPERGATSTATPTPSVAPPPPAEPPPPGAEFRLSGMASTQGPDGPVWTAMVHDGQGLLYVQRGDALPGGFEVADIQETWLTLRDSAGGERTLRLR